MRRADRPARGVGIEVRDLAVLVDLQPVDLVARLDLVGQHAEEVVERVVLHHQDDDVLDLRHRRRALGQAREWQRSWAGGLSGGDHGAHPGGQAAARRGDGQRAGARGLEGGAPVESFISTEHRAIVCPYRGRSRNQCVNAEGAPHVGGALSTGSLVCAAEAAVGYGVVVDRVNRSVLAYVPVLSACVAPIDCLNPSVTGSLLVGAA